MKDEEINTTKIDIIKIDTKTYCEKNSMAFMRKLADCNSSKTSPQKCRNKIHKEYKEFIYKCIVKKAYN